MDKIQEEQTKILNELIQVCHDGSIGYSEAAKDVEDDELQTIFNRFSQQRKMYAEELKNEVLTLGGDPVNNRSTEGYLHHQWLKIKSLVASGDTESLIDACKTGEQYAAEVYSSHVADANLPSFLREKVIKQYEMIKGAIQQIEDLT
jgi:uncharacterized protein (TIGR02284 family)